MRKEHRYIAYNTRILHHVWKYIYIPNYIHKLSLRRALCYRPIVLDHSTTIEIRYPVELSSQSKTLPATAAALLSLVCVFFNCFLAWISPRNPAGLPAGSPPPKAGAGIGGGGGGPPGAPPIPGIGGGGGAPIGGIGGGGGAPVFAIGGGDGASVAGKGGGGGGDDGPVATIGLSGAETCPAAERGRAGPILPKSIAARALAPRVPGPSSSDESSLSDPAADQSSSSTRRRDGLVLVGWATSGSVLGTSWLEGVRRNGLVETADGEKTSAAACGANFLKNGFLVSGSAGVTGITVFTAEDGTGGTKEGA